MRTYRALAFLSMMSVLVLTAGVSLAQDTTSKPPAYKVIGYYSSWSIYDRAYFVTDIPADKLTTINYAFALISDDGKCMLGDEVADTQYKYPGDTDGEKLLGNFKQLQLLKAAHPGLQTVISVGGWTGSAKFSDAALTDASRKKFAASCVSFMTQYGFDGIDIDWEYPTGGGNDGNSERPEDAANFVLMMTELRSQLDAAGKESKHYLLTMATGTGDEISGLDWARLSPLLDWVNVMTYDYSGSWSDVTGFNAPLYDSTANPPEGGSDDSAINAYMAAGIPADHLVLGVPFYGHGWTGAKAVDNGLHQTYTGLVEGSDDGLDYRNLTDELKMFKRYWDDTAQVPWLYDSATGTMITYDDAQSIGMKADYVKQKGLGGMMIWELASDDPSATLLNALHDGLAGSK